jgi:hypothetical protein
MMQIVREAKSQEDPREIWGLLKEHFHGTYEFNLVELNRELLGTSMKKKPSMTLAAFIDKINSLSVRLAAVVCRCRQFE